ncbi:MAG: hypothetical protein AB1486_27585 [Planctomycetota bacterium]
MSQKLASIAKPWIDRLGESPPQPSMAAAYALSSLIWNASRLPEPAEREVALAEARGLFAQALSGLPMTKVVELVREIYERACRLYPDDARLILGTDVEDRGGGQYFLRVATLDHSGGQSSASGVDTSHGPG